MPEQLVTRTEHSRSVEDAESFKALETLKEVGLLIPLSEIETFHGRVGSADEIAEWAVDPSFANGSNYSGNSNVNNRPTLYSGEQQVAKDFALERGPEMIRPKYYRLLQDKVRDYTPEERQEWLERENTRKQEWWDRLDDKQRRLYPDGPRFYTLDDFEDRVWAEAHELEDRMPYEDKNALWHQAQEGLRAEVHEIVSTDTDATVINFDFGVNKLDKEAKQKYLNALKALAIPITEGSPVDWNARGMVKPFATTMKRLGKNIFLSNDIAKLAAEAGIDEEVALQLGSAFNARQLAHTSPAFLANELMKHKNEIFNYSFDINGEQREAPINVEYVQRFLRHAHIVGAKHQVISATLNREISVVSFFDLEKTITAKGLESERQATWQKLGEMATALDSIQVAEADAEHPLLQLLTDVHAKPEKLVAAAKLVEGYDTIFDGDAGNLEGFTLAEHTETVLRNFDENYADRLPVELIAPMRLAILAHDVGKPIATARGEKYRQKEYNVAQAGDFLTKLGVNEKLKGLLLAVIGDGDELAFQIDIRGAGQAAEAAMHDLATQTLSQFYGTESVTEGQIGSFTEMCKILQICDGGAYTSMAITSRTGGQGRHRNAPSFNASFAKPVGFGRRDIRLREDGDDPAPADLTPSTNDNPSKLRISHKGAGRRAPKLST